MKYVDMYIRGSQNHEDNSGKYAVLLEYKDSQKMLLGKGINTTANRMLITALIRGIMLLKTPCKITLYTPTPLGFKSIKKSINKDLLLIAIESIEKGGHEFEEIVTNDKQNLLKKELRKLDN